MTTHRESATWRRFIPDEKAWHEAATWPELTEEQLDELAPLLKELARHVRQVRRERRRAA